jgi:hypothetical protein
MAGKSRVTAGEEQRNGLETLAHSRDRGEADRARAILLTLSGWTSPRIAEAFGVREDTVRPWRSEFARDGVAALKATVAPGPAPVKTEAAGSVGNFVCGRSVKHYAAIALMKRSPKITANWALAMDHSRGGIFHSFSDRFKIR